MWTAIFSVFGRRFIPGGVALRGRWAWGVILCAGITAAGCARGQQPSTALDGALSEPERVDEGAYVRPFDELALESGASQDADPALVRLRAEAWPETSSVHPWRVLEEGVGALLSKPEVRGPWRVILLSREPSAWASGLLVQIPSEVAQDALPTRVQVRTSPTPREITRTGWPAVSRLLEDEGIADLELRPGARVALFFPQEVRVSIVELIVWSSRGDERVGLGKVSLIRGGIDRSGLQATPVELLVEEGERAPVDEGALDGVF